MIPISRMDAREEFMKMDFQLNDLIEFGLKYIIWPVIAGVATVAGWVVCAVLKTMRIGAKALWAQFIEKIDSLNSNVSHLNDNMTKMLAWRDGQEQWKAGMEKRMDRFEAVVMNRRSD
jgi:hypothetical protein